MDLNLHRNPPNTPSSDPSVVVPSSMRFYTALPHSLAANNPTLFRDVVSVLNRIDRSRNVLFRQVIGDLKVFYG